MTRLYPFALVMAVLVGTGCSSGGTHVPGSGGHAATGGNAATGGAHGDGGGATGGSGGAPPPATGGTTVSGSGGGSGGIHGTGGTGSGGQSGGSGGTGGGSASGGQAGSSMDAATDSGSDAQVDTQVDTQTPGPGWTAVLAVFKKRCTDCHAAGAIVPGMPKLHLTADVAYSSLVGKPAEETCGGILVVPNDSAKSYLYRKLADATSCEGVQMPMAYEGLFTPLSTADLDTIRGWIDQGAPP